MHALAQSHSHNSVALIRLSSPSYAEVLQFYQWVKIISMLLIMKNIVPGNHTHTQKTLMIPSLYLLWWLASVRPHAHLHCLTHSQMI